MIKKYIINKIYNFKLLGGEKKNIAKYFNAHLNTTHKC